MPKQRVQQGSPQGLVTVTVACGSTDATTNLDVIAPSDAARIVRVVATQKTAGGTTGTFTVTLMDGANAVADALTVDADAVAGTYLDGQKGNGRPISEGARLSIATVKTGTVNADATIILAITFGY